MEDMDNSYGDLMQRLQSSMGISSSFIPKQQLNKYEPSSLPINQTRPAFTANIQNFSFWSKRQGIPPSHPHFPPTSPHSHAFFNQMPVLQSPVKQNSQNQQHSNATHTTLHSRSMSQIPLMNYLGSSALYLKNSRKSHSTFLWKSIRGATLLQY